MDVDPFCTNNSVRLLTMAETKKGGGGDKLTNVVFTGLNNILSVPTSKSVYGAFFAPCWFCVVFSHLH